MEVLIGYVCPEESLLSEAYLMNSSGELRCELEKEFSRNSQILGLAYGRLRGEQIRDDP